ncbi:hypothetical protein GF342_03140 [Candidatus Woesearchaeota archaeon]|nr:hypothetical protein [Candidatus Woesearchaeota archaeon]
MDNYKGPILQLTVDHVSYGWRRLGEQTEPYATLQLSRVSFVDCNDQILSTYKRPMSISLHRDQLNALQLLEYEWDGKPEGLKPVAEDLEGRTFQLGMQLLGRVEQREIRERSA